MVHKVGRPDLAARTNDTSVIQKCSVCGFEYRVSRAGHYIARDNDRTGIANVMSKDDVTIYDAIDCPACGCQNILQARKYVAHGIGYVVGIENGAAPADDDDDDDVLEEDY